MTHSSIKGIFYIEAQGNNKRLVEDSLKAMAKKFHEEKNIKVKKEYSGEVIEEDGNFSSTLEAELEFQDFLTYVMASIHYGPSLIEIVAPEKLKLGSKELLDAIGEVIKISRSLYNKYSVSLRFPEKRETKIGLTDEELKGLLNRGAIRATIVVECGGRTRKEAIKCLLQTIPENVFVNRVKSRKVESECPFSGLIGINALMYGVKTLFDIAVRHTPVLIEIMEPKEIEVSMLELQDIGVDLAGVFFELAHIVARPTS
jgi:hypothetical protein